MAERNISIEVLRQRLRSWEEEQTLLRRQLQASGADATLVAKEQQLSGDIRAIRRRIDVLERGKFQPEDCDRSTLTWLNQVGSGKALLAAYRTDPAIASTERGRLRKLDGDLADALFRYRDRRAQKTLTSLDELYQVPGVHETIVHDLRYTVCFELGGAAKPGRTPPQLGVLLPLYLETRFQPPDSRRLSWRLRLRIVPDQIAVDHHDPRPTADELDDLEWLWQACDGDLGSKDGRAAWQGFCQRHEVARAAWLWRSFADGGSGGHGLRPLPAGRARPGSKPGIRRPAEIRAHGEAPHFPRIRGMPRRLAIYLARSGGAPALMRTLHVDVEDLVLDLPEGLGAAHQARWWNSYRRAREVGLAADLDLGPGNPDDIDALYVVGLSDEEPETLLAAHRDTGELSLIPLGTATNSVDGGSTAAGRGDVETYWRLLTSRVPQDGSRRVGEFLLGNERALEPIIDGDHDQGPLGEALMKSLWEVLFGHGLRDYLGIGASKESELGLWAGTFVRPEGPLPPLRVGRQPYGLLPVVSLAALLRQAKIRRFPAADLRTLDRLADLWRDRVEEAGNVVGADTERLLDLIGHTAHSREWRTRGFVSLAALVEWLNDLAPNLMDTTTAQQQWEEEAKPLLDLPVSIKDPLVTLGFAQRLPIPLVAAPGKEQAFKDRLLALAQAGVNDHADGGYLQPEKDQVRVDSLLARLLAASLSQAARLLLDTPAGDPLHSLRDKLFVRAQEALPALAEAPVAELERAFRAVLDTASHRLDPWVGGVALDHLESLLQDEPQRWLGVYGWVDRPRPGEPGSVPETLVSAPSPDQCRAAIVLRDRALRDPERERWSMQLDSRCIRGAERLARAVREGIHPAAALGAEVERIAADPQLIDKIRERFPLNREAKRRRVCDGLAVLGTAADEVDALAPQMTPRLSETLLPLRRALDAYSDLLPAEGVYRVANGRADIAGAAMDAAAGLALPPELEVIRTPRTGRTITTTVLGTLRAPDRAVAQSPHTGKTEAGMVLVGKPGDEGSGTRKISIHDSPLTIADAAVAGYLGQVVAGRDDPRWHWTAKGTEGQTIADVLLADLGLSVAEVAVLPRSELQRLVRMQAGEEAVTVASGPVDALLERLQRALAALPRAPATPANLGLTGEAKDNAPLRADLLARYTRLYATAQALHTALGNAGADAGPVLARAAAWGLIPADGRENDQPTTDLAGMMATRLAQSPEPAAAADLTLDGLVRAIAELATADGRYPVLTRYPRKLLTDGRQRDIAGETGAINALDERWLSIVAAVREPLARLELQQLANEGNRSAWSLWSDPATLDDPFHTAPAWDPRTKVAARPKDVPWVDPETGQPKNSHVRLCYAAPGTLDGDGDEGDEVAVGLLDFWTEVVPDVVQDAGAGFAFRAPPARAPQAVLLAIPGNPERELKDDDLLDTLVEVRRLTRVRMAEPGQLEGLRAGVSTILLADEAPYRVDLSPWEDK